MAGWEQQRTRPSRVEGGDGHCRVPLRDGPLDHRVGRTADGGANDGHPGDRVLPGQRHGADVDAALGEDRHGARRGGRLQDGLRVRAARQAGGAAVIVPLPGWQGQRAKAARRARPRGAAEGDDGRVRAPRSCGGAAGTGSACLSTVRQVGGGIGKTCLLWRLVERATCLAQHFTIF